MLVAFGGEGMKNSLLRIEHLTKVYRIGSIIGGTRITAVDDVSFGINGSEIFTLAGESGCGKTTIAKIVLGFEDVTNGEVYYSGKKIDNLKKRGEIFKEIQAVFQNPFTTFNPLRRVESYFYDTLKNFEISKSKEEATAIITEKLKTVGIEFDEFYHKYPSEFSGGQLQRISIAKSLLTNPKLLVADEPVSMVDASLRMSIVNLFKKLQELGISILYITHDLMTAYYLGGRIAIMFRGNIVETGSTERVLSEPKHPYTQLLKDSIPQPDPKKKWSTRIKLSDLEEVEYVSTGCKFAGRCPYAMGICRKERPPYFDVNGSKVMCYLYK